MSDALVIDFAALQHASGQIQRAIDALDRQLDEVEREAEALAATWDGQARAEYERRRVGWRRTAERLSAMLRDIRLAVDRSAAEYRCAEYRNGHRFR